MDEVELMPRDQESGSSDTETEHLLSPVRIHRPPRMPILRRSASQSCRKCRACKFYKKGVLHVKNQIFACIKEHKRGKRGRKEKKGGKGKKKKTDMEVY